MKNPESGKQIEETSTKKEPKISLGFSIPMRASIEDIIRALGILADKGGKARFKDISGMFGPKNSQRNLLSNSLNAGDAFSLIASHRGKAPYILSSFGTEFLTAPEERRKAMLLPKFLGFKGYRDILVQMKNKPDKSLKKETLTNAWLNVVSGSKLSTRQLYTTTFASVGNWCGAIKDTGQTCSLVPEGEAVLNQILKGEEVKLPEQPPSAPTTPTLLPTVPATPLLPSIPSIQCPHCNKTELGIENEELLNTLSSNGTHILVIKTIYYCRGCSRTFSMIGQRMVKPDT